MNIFSMNENLKVSIIMVCLNAEANIEGAIKTVLFQTYRNLEFIVVDGGSSDGTLAILNRYQNKIHKIISEKDNGIYDAMNKGVHNASGDIVYFLNTDDRLYDPQVVVDVVKEFHQDEHAGLIYGKVKGINAPPECSLDILNYTKEIKTRWDMIIHGLCHQRIFCRKSVFEEVGLFDQQFKVFADLDWILKAYNRSITFRFIDRFISIYNCRGASFLKRHEVIPEKIKVTHQNASPAEFIGYFLYAAIRKIKDIFLEEYRRRRRLNQRSPARGIKEFILQKAFYFSPFNLLGDLKKDPEQERQPILSCLICASLRPQELDMLLEDLSSQTFQKNQFEVIIINDGGGPRVDAIIEKYSRTLSLKSKGYESPQKIIGRLRNESIALSQGQYILFLDDDTRLLQKDFLKRAWVIFTTKNPDVIMPLGHPLYGLTQEKYCFLDDYSFANRCCLYKYSVLKNISGFKDSLKAYEDIEMSIRLSICGIKVLQSDELEYYHPPLYFSSLDKPLAIGQTIWQMKKDYSLLVWMIVYLNALRFLWYGLIPTPRHRQWFKISLGVLLAPFTRTQHYY